MYYDEIICKGKKYQIKKGDTLYSISRKEEIPLEWILQANPYVNVYNLQIGDWICIPKQMCSTGNNMSQHNAMQMRPGAGVNNNRKEEQMGLGPVVSDNRNEVQMGLRPVVNGNRKEEQMGFGSVVYGNRKEEQIGTGTAGNTSRNEVQMEVRPAVSDNRNEMPIESMNSEYMISRKNAVIEYVVGDTDNLEEIMRKFNIGLEELLKYNGMNAVSLKKGCILKIPKTADDILNDNY